MIDALILIPEITKGMKSIGSKSLLKIRKTKHIIDHQIEQIQSISKKIRIHIATGFDNEKIKKIVSKYNNPNINILHNADYETTNYGRSVELLINNLQEDSNGLFILCSGVLFKKNTFHHTCLKNNSKIFLLNNTKSNFNIGCTIGDKIEYMFYDLPEPWAECAFLNSEAIGRLKNLATSKTIKQMYVFEILNDLMSQNVNFEKKYILKGKFFKINGTKDLTKARAFI